MVTQDHQKYFREICKQLEEDIGAPICEDLIKQFEDHPECKQYFESVQKMVELYQECNPKVQVTKNMKNNLINKLKEKQKESNC